MSKCQENVENDQLCRISQISKSQIAGLWMRLIDLRVIPFLGFDIHPTIGGGVCTDHTSINSINLSQKGNFILSDFTHIHPNAHPPIGGGLSKDHMSPNRINFLDLFKSYSIFSDLTIAHPPIHPNTNAPTHPYTYAPTCTPTHRCRSIHRL